MRLLARTCLQTVVRLAGSRASHRTGAAAVAAAAASALLLCASSADCKEAEPESKLRLYKQRSTTDNDTPMISMDDLIGALPNVKCTTGTITVKGGLQVKWWKYEHVNTPTNTPPVVALHGGPAFTHNYILPLKLLADKGFPVIFYDQAGCGGSTWVEDPATDAPWLLTIPYYVSELKTVVEELGLEAYYVYGSSWGTCLAQEFAVAQPKGLLGLILDGALCDGQQYIQTADSIPVA